jgi:hypothetical protein
LGCEHRDLTALRIPRSDGYAARRTLLRFKKNEQKQLEIDSWLRLTEPADIAINRNKPPKSRMIWLFLINLAAGDGKS